MRGGSRGGHGPGSNASAVARAIDERHKVWSDRLPDAPSELWATLGALDADEQTALFAHCASFGINAVFEPANRYNESRESARAVSGRRSAARRVGNECVSSCRSRWSPEH